jgi:hypothetical protein
MYTPKVGSLTVIAERARGTLHPPVLQPMAFKPGQGVLPAGLILENSASGLIPHDTGSIVGVNDAAVDTAVEDSGLVIIHGSALRDMLKADTAGTFPDDATLAALIALGVYPE